jgi:hypothetical protein
MNNNTILGLLVVAVVAGGAYWTYASYEPEGADDQPIVTNPMGGTNSAEGAPEGSMHNLPVEPAAAAARKDLAAKLGISESSIVIMQIEEKTWNDGCLGLGQPNESCLMALVDGFKVEMTANGESYTYRTDKTGAAVRAETK